MNANIPLPNWEGDLSFLPLPGWERGCVDLNSIVFLPDLEKGVIHVNGAAVPGEDHKFTRKAETKNTTSRRTVPIIPPLMAALQAVEHRGEMVVTYHPATVMNQVNRVCEKAGLPKVGLHGLRHSFASLAYHLGWPEKVAMEIGGWADDRTMHKIYTHVSQKSVEEAGASFAKFFDSAR